MVTARDDGLCLTRINTAERLATTHKQAGMQLPTASLLAMSQAQLCKEMVALCKVARPLMSEGLSLRDVARDDDEDDQHTHSSVVGVEDAHEMRMQTSHAEESDGTERRQQLLIKELDEKIAKAEGDYRRKRLVAQGTSVGVVCITLAGYVFDASQMPECVKSAAMLGNAAQWNDLKEAGNRLRNYREERVRVLKSD